MPEHARIGDCIQGPAFKAIDSTLLRLESHSERNTIALEDIARQGAMVQNHEKRLDKVETDVNNLGEKIRIIEQRHDIDHGKDEVLGEQKKFWTDVKQRLAGPVLVSAFFLVWAFDRFNIAIRIAKLLKEMKG